MGYFMDEFKLNDNKTFKIDKDEFEVVDASASKDMSTFKAGRHMYHEHEYDGDDGKEHEA